MTPPDRPASDGLAELIRKTYLEWRREHVTYGFDDAQMPQRLIDIIAAESRRWLLDEVLTRENIGAALERPIFQWEADAIRALLEPK